MHSDRLVRPALAALTIALLGAPGCSQAPTTPGVYASRQPSFVRVSAPSHSGTTALTGTGTTSIVFKFNGTAIPAGSTVWFNSVLKYSNVPSTLVPVVIHVSAGTIQFPVNGVVTTVPVPAATVVLSPTATLATTTFDPVTQSWTTVTPFGTAGNVFLAGAVLPLATSLPGGVDSVTWTASFTCSTPGVSVSWRWGAAAYGSFGTDLGRLGVKPVDDGHVSNWLNSDHAGTPESFKSQLIAGATGGGGSNWTGGLSSTLSIVPVLGASGPLSGTAVIDGGHGGTLTVGRFTLQVPAGAWSGSATIGISIPDQGLMQCDLSISPLSANQFAVPVTLIGSYAGASVTDPSSLIEVWFDPSAQLWREVPGSSVDTVNQVVSGPLSHFSSYGVAGGKAGW